MLRKAGADDIPAIDRCNRAVLAENYTPDLYERLFAEDAAASCFVVEEIEESVEEVVGYVLFYIEMIRGRPVCHVMSLGILPEHRRRGHAEALMRAARGDILERYCVAKFTLHVRKSNKRAQALYFKLGYGRSKKVKKYYADSEDAYVMERVES